MIHTIIDACGALFLLSVMIVFAFGAWMMASGERRDRYAPVMPESEPNLPLSPDMADAIRRDVSTALDEARTRLMRNAVARERRDNAARRAHACHAAGLGVQWFDVDAIVVAEVDQ